MRTLAPRLRADEGNTGGGGGTNTPVAKGAYYASDAQIPGGLGWVVIAEFDLDVLPASAVLDAIALVSQGALTAHLKLYDVTGGADVAGSTLTTSSTTGARLTSGDLVAALVVGRRYQILTQCTGGSAQNQWAVVRYATVVPL